MGATLEGWAVLGKVRGTTAFEKMLLISWSFVPLRLRQRA
jgi:hypothetical protein